MCLYSPKLNYTAILAQTGSRLALAGREEYYHFLEYKNVFACLLFEEVCSYIYSVCMLLSMVPPPDGLS